MKMIASAYTKERRYNKIKHIIKENKMLIILITMIICLVLVDQITKIAIIKTIYNSSVTIVQGVLNFTYVENTGGAFGIGDNNVIMFIIVNVIIITLITKFILSKKNGIPAHVLFSLGLIMAGGLGNLVDRIFRGFVVDYIDFSPLIKYPVFNFADICVVLGCVIVGIGEINERIQNKKRRTRN